MLPLELGKGTISLMPFRRTNDPMAFMESMNKTLKYFARILL